MFVEEIRQAVTAAPRHRLAELSAAVWKGFAAGVIAESEAQSLAELIEARKVVPVAPATPRRPVGSRPRSSASLERRRAWTGSGWMPPAIAARFTMGEAAAIGVIVAEIAARGQCMLSIGAIAGRAGVCLTIVRNALRQARSLGLLHVDPRRVARDRNLPNVVTIISRELELWVRTRARVESQGGGCRSVVPTTNHILSSPERPAKTDWKAGTFDEGNRKVWANRLVSRGAETAGRRHRPGRGSWSSARPASAPCIGRERCPQRWHPARGPPFNVGGMLMDADRGTVDHLQVAVIGGRNRVEDSVPTPRGRPEGRPRSREETLRGDRLDDQRGLIVPTLKIVLGSAFQRRDDGDQYH